MPTRIFLIAAARPNFMKVAPIWRALDARSDVLDVELIHTGQHYDKNMSDVFFADLGLPRPHVNLGVGGGTHAEQTAGVMLKFEQLCRERRPDLVLVVGDVNATMATTITARKLGVSVAHVEAGLRSRDWSMPEEINRILTDSIADILYTPSEDADANLAAEGVPAAKIVRVGNVMIDSLVHAAARVRGNAKYADFGMKEKEYGLVTLHRPSNVDDPGNLERLFAGLERQGVPMIFPVHPRTRKVMAAAGLDGRYPGPDSRLVLTDPMGYDDFLNLTMHARFVLTDSGGIQEETTYLDVPCLTMRPNTERPITITIGTNELVTLESLDEMVAKVLSGSWKQGRVPEMWDGGTGERIAEHIVAWAAGRGGD